MSLFSPPTDLEKRPPCAVVGYAPALQIAI